MRKELVLQDKTDMGMDMFVAYEYAANTSRIPLFRHIYDDYRMHILGEETRLNAQKLQEVNKFVNDYVGSIHDLEQTQKETLPIRTEAEVYNYLLLQKYFFTLNGKLKDTPNFPIGEVW